MYTEKTIEHFRNPHNYGSMKKPDGIGKVGNVVCVPPSTMIQVNNSYFPISDLTEKHKTLSHDGKFHRIKKVFSRAVDEEILLIKNKFGETLLTKEHLVLAAKVPKSHYYNYTRNKKKLLKNLQWHHACELKRGDLIAYPILKNKIDIKNITIKFQKSKWDFKSREIPQNIKINSNFLRLLGYYISEGWLADKTTEMRAGFTFNSKETDLVNDVSSIIKKEFGLETKLSVPPGRNAVHVYANNVFLVKLFKKLCGKGAKNKSIPPFAMFLPPGKQKHLLKGLWKGDGYFSPQRIQPRAGYSTISSKLAQQLCVLLLRQGIIASQYVEKEKKKNKVKRKKNYRIHVGDRQSLNKLAAILGTNFKNPRDERVESWISDNYAFLPLTAVKPLKHKGIVHNLEVAETKSFATNSLCLHNCGDVMHLYIKVGKKGRDEVISDIRFETFGCAAAIATSSVVTDLAKGRTLEYAMGIGNQDVVKALGGLPPIKVHCSLLAADALKEAIYDYLKRSKRPVSKNLEEHHKRLVADIQRIEEEYGELKQERVG